MKLGFFVNEVAREKPEYSTTRMARAAIELGHEVHYLDANSFTFRPDDRVLASAQTAGTASGTREQFLEELQAAQPNTFDLAELDVLLLRNDPGEDLDDRPWAAATHIVFGHVAQSLGVEVVNDPAGLARAANKLYLQEFPQHVRPRTLISRDEEEIDAFIKELDGDVVMKPLLGAKGEKVFFVQGMDDPNVNQMIETVSEDGYVVVQEFLHAASEGDIRFFVLDGRPLEKDGKYAAFRRRPADDELRSNMSAGGTAEALEVTDEILAVIEEVGPKLRADGMFLAGLDIVGTTLVEANVETPGGLESVERFTGIDFAPEIIKALEAKASGS